MSDDVESPLQRIDWLAKFLGCTEWSARDAIRSRRVPEWCVIRFGGHIRVNESQVRHWANGGKEPLV